MHIPRARTGTYEPRRVRRHAERRGCQPPDSRAATTSRLTSVWIATVGALDAFVRGSERRIDLAGVDGRVFVNNASLGVFAKIVRSADYRDGTAETVARIVPAHRRASHLRRPQSQRDRPRT